MTATSHEAQQQRTSVGLPPDGSDPTPAPPAFLTGDARSTLDDALRIFVETAGDDAGTIEREELADELRAELRRAPAQRFAITPKQLSVCEAAIERGQHAAAAELIGPDELARIGLDLPAGTVELRQGDSFAAVTPDGQIIEST